MLKAPPPSHSMQQPHLQDGQADEAREGRAVLAQHVLDCAPVEGGHAVLQQAAQGHDHLRSPNTGCKDLTLIPGQVDSDDRCRVARMPCAR